jgi:hypothetical protein
VSRCEVVAGEQIHAASAISVQRKRVPVRHAATRQIVDAATKERIDWLPERQSCFVWHR